MNIPEEQLKIGDVYLKEEIQALGLEIKRQVHAGLICRKDNIMYFFDPLKPKEGKGYRYIKAIED